MRAIAPRPTDPEHAARAYGPADRRDVVASMARAFTIDPLFSHFSRDRLHAHRLLPQIFNGYLADLASMGECWVAERSGSVVGFAGWLPPGGFPRGARRELSTALRTGPTLLRSAHPIGAVRLFAEVERIHPHEPHWYLALLAVDPDWQGRGLGAGLLEPALARADEEGLPCYLETQKQENLAWYARFGFDLTSTIELAGLPPVWALTRAAR